MIIATKENVCLNGNCVEVLAEFASIAATLMAYAELTSDDLKLAIDVAYNAKENVEDVNTSD